MVPLRWKIKVKNSYRGEKKHDREREDGNQRLFINHMMLKKKKTIIN